MGSTWESRMLSRQAISRATQARNCLVVSTRGLSLSTPNAERDLVNYPARVRPIDKPPVRLGIFPEEWFTAMHPKTGVTGPYMALFGVSTFLASKEFFVMEHDFYVGIGLAAVLAFVVKQVGPDWTASINQQLDEEEAALKGIRQNEIDFCKSAIAAEEESQAKAAAWEDIIAAKKEAVGLNSKQFTEQDFNPLTHRSRKVLTINWRLLMLLGAWNRNTWLIGL